MLGLCKEQQRPVWLEQSEPGRWQRQEMRSEFSGGRDPKDKDFTGVLHRARGPTTCQRGSRSSALMPAGLHPAHDRSDTISEGEKPSDVPEEEPPLIPRGHFKPRPLPFS